MDEEELTFIVNFSYMHITHLFYLGSLTHGHLYFCNSMNIPELYSRI
jgi:hypothetical protein